MILFVHKYFRIYRTGHAPKKKDITDTCIINASIFGKVYTCIQSKIQNEIQSSFTRYKIQDTRFPLSLSLSRENLKSQKDDFYFYPIKISKGGLF